MNDQYADEAAQQINDHAVKIQIYLIYGKIMQGATAHKGTEQTQGNKQAIIAIHQKRADAGVIIAERVWWQEGFVHLIRQMFGWHARAYLSCMKTHEIYENKDF